MIIRAECVGKKVDIVDVYGQKYTGKVVELEGPEETESGEPEIGINFAGGITMFAESEIVDLRIMDENKGSGNSNIY